MKSPTDRRGFMKLATAGALAPVLQRTAGAVRADVGEFAPRVERWGIQEVTLRSSKTYTNPFTDVQFEGRFKSATYIGYRQRVTPY